MQAFTHFSRHAFERVTQRTKLSCEEISRILDLKLALNTGRKPGLNRSHLLFYSHEDNDFFVAIQDDLTGTVVTILPLDYHANLAWSISPEECSKAKELFFSVPQEEVKSHKKFDAVQFVISIHYLDDNGKQKTKVLKKISSQPYNNKIKNLLTDESFFTKLDMFITEHGLDARQVFGISIRLGSHGVPVFVDLQEVKP